LEEEMQPNGLVSDWTTIKKACNHLDKRRQLLEETDEEKAQALRRKAPVTTVPSQEMNGFDKKAMEESIIEELSKKFEAVSLANMGRRLPKGKDVYRCVWCVFLEHSKRDCADLQEAVHQNIVYLDSNMIHSS
jgi:Fe-S-cluster containining protein